MLNSVIYRLVEEIRTICLAWLILNGEVVRNKAHYPVFDLWWQHPGFDTF